MDYAKEALRLHGEWKGKIEVKATVPVATKDDLSLAYTPGVAAPCLEIQADSSFTKDAPLSSSALDLICSIAPVSTLK